MIGTPYNPAWVPDDDFRDHDEARYRVFKSRVDGTYGVACVQWFDYSGYNVEWQLGYSHSEMTARAKADELEAEDRAKRV